MGGRARVRVPRPSPTSTGGGGGSRHLASMVLPEVLTYQGAARFIARSPSPTRNRTPVTRPSASRLKVKWPSLKGMSNSVYDTGTIASAPGWNGNMTVR
jgi:hypothetical protein